MINAQRCGTVCVAVHQRAVLKTHHPGVYILQCLFEMFYYGSKLKSFLAATPGGMLMHQQRRTDNRKTIYQQLFMQYQLPPGLYGEIYARYADIVMGTGVQGIFTCQFYAPHYDALFPQGEVDIFCIKFIRTAGFPAHKILYNVYYFIFHQVIEHTAGYYPDKDNDQQYF